MIYKNSIFGLLLGMVFSLQGCIENDLPYPTIKGEILEIDMEGMVSAKINDATNRILVKVADTLDLKDVRIKKLKVTEGATLIPEAASCIDFKHFPDTGFVSADSLPPTANTRMNVKKPAKILLRIYQDYLWTIDVQHDIKRVIKVKNQTGTPLVDEDNKQLIIYVDKQLQPKFDNIEIEQLQLGSSIAKTIPLPDTIHDFRRPQTFSVTAFNDTEKWTVSVMHPSDDMQQIDLSVWARRVYLKGTTKTGDVLIQYRKQGEEQWETVLSNELSIDKEDFIAMITHLQAETTYEYIISVDGKTEDLKSFTTDKMINVPNLNFDNWISANGTVYPNLDLDANYFWDSGNGGAKTASKTPTEEETRNVVKGSAAKLHSEYAMVAFAAGNLYTGEFIKAIMDLKNPGAELDFGRPYTGRPSGMKGYYSYKPGIIDYAAPAYSTMMGQKDSCHIYIALFDWKQPFRVNTQKSEFVDLTWENESMIAFGEFKTNAGNSDYSTFKINMTYRDYFTKPTYILIVASASKYGDYFTGSTSSVLLLDECELVFE